MTEAADGMRQLLYDGSLDIITVGPIVYQFPQYFGHDESSILDCSRVMKHHHLLSPSRSH